MASQSDTLRVGGSVSEEEKALFLAAAEGPATGRWLVAEFDGSAWVCHWFVCDPVWGLVAVGQPQRVEHEGVVNLRSRGAEHDPSWEVFTAWGIWPSLGITIEKWLRDGATTLRGMLGARADRTSWQVVVLATDHWAHPERSGLLGRAVEEVVGSGVRVLERRVALERGRELLRTTAVPPGAAADADYGLVVLTRKGDQLLPGEVVLVGKGESLRLDGDRVRGGRRLTLSVLPGEVSAELLLFRRDRVTTPVAFSRITPGSGQVTADVSFPLLGATAELTVSGAGSSQVLTCPRTVERVEVAEQQNPLQLAVVLDTTLDGPALAKVRKELEQAVSDLAVRRPSVELALVTFGDYPRLHRETRATRGSVGRAVTPGFVPPAQWPGFLARVQETTTTDFMTALDDGLAAAAALPWTTGRDRVVVAVGGRVPHPKERWPGLFERTHLTLAPGCWKEIAAGLRQAGTAILSVRAHVYPRDTRDSCLDDDLASSDWEALGEGGGSTVMVDLVMRVIAVAGSRWVRVRGPAVPVCEGVRP